MEEESFIERVKTTQQCLIALHSRLGGAPEPKQNRFEEVLGGLSAAIAVLRVVIEKLGQQSRALIAARQAIQVERQRYQELLMERQRVEEALRQEHHKLELERKRLRTVLDILPSALWVVDATGQILAQSALSKTIWAEDGLVDDEPREYKGWWADTGQELKPEEWSRVRALTKGETSLNEEINIEAFDGSKKTILSSAVPIRDEQGAVVGAVVWNMDITKRKQAEEALRKSAAKNRALLNAIPDMMFQISHDGTYLDYKPAKDLDEFMLAAQFLGKKIAEVLPPALAQQTMRYVERALQSGETQIYEYQMLINGKMRDREARIIASGEYEVLAIVRDITGRKAREALLKEERARIARDLHDGLAQNLYFLGLKLDYIRKQVGCDPDHALAELSALKKTVQANIHDVRRTIFALRPVDLEGLGFGPALRKYTHEFGEQVGLEVSLNLQGDEAALPAALEPVFFRLIQEGLTNIAKHAHARHTWIDLTIDPGQVGRLTIQDDGLGFDPQATLSTNSGKLGLRQMRERVVSWDGDFRVKSALAQGTTLSIEIPLAGGNR